ncbi:hypothetical protein BDP55DRAFT_663444 [Colletotrichum godetiae]|uniref:Uncharacterized protein n=1 Tax=Colletotrichum godetiae TaxID=1209918 RepID=A0AAJ0EVU7_9PEZI|nr:uncharacterized protein BDP55DRAFT_663444 [Colletotrichum godetiae]KAK1675683.1 hypothetical protein BDP55DRAFT_663444 [Colletotrichum godetiae]
MWMPPPPKGGWEPGALDIHTRMWDHEVEGGPWSTRLIRDESGGSSGRAGSLVDPQPEATSETLPVRVGTYAPCPDQDTTAVEYGVRGYHEILVSR